MLCPHDHSELVVSERRGVEIDYCPTCRGVWLDRDELDKIIDRSLDAEIAAEAMGPSAAPFERASHDGSHDGSPRPEARNETWLGELFDY